MQLGTSMVKRQGLGRTTRSEAAEGDDEAVEDSILDSAGWWDMAEPRRECEESRRGGGVAVS